MPFIGAPPEDPTPTAHGATKRVDARGLGRRARGSTTPASISLGGSARTFVPRRATGLGVRVAYVGGSVSCRARASLMAVSVARLNATMAISLAEVFGSWVGLVCRLRVGTAISRYSSWARPTRFSTGILP